MEAEELYVDQRVVYTSPRMTDVGTVIELIYGDFGLLEILVKWDSDGAEESAPLANLTPL